MEDGGRALTPQPVRAETWARMSKGKRRADAMEVAMTVGFIAAEAKNEIVDEGLEQKEMLVFLVLLCWSCS